MKRFYKNVFLAMGIFILTIFVLLSKDMCIYKKEKVDIMYEKDISANIYSSIKCKLVANTEELDTNLSEESVNVLCKCDVPENFDGNINCKLVNKENEEDSYVCQLKKLNNYTAIFETYNIAVYSIECVITDEDDEYEISCPEEIFVEKADNQENILEITVKNKVVNIQEDDSSNSNSNLPTAKERLKEDIKSSWFTLALLVVLISVLFIIEKKKKSINGED